MKLYTYFRSSASFRVRIALHLKRIEFDVIAIDLRAPSDDQRRAAYRAINPQELVPALQVGDITLTQSLAIVDYLDELYPEPALLPFAPLKRAQVRAIALSIACDLHPLNNLRVLNLLRYRMGQSQEQIDGWYRHWVSESFQALEEEAKRMTADGRYFFGDGVTLADVCLVPQMYNARRFNCDLEPYPTLRSVCANLETLPAFADAAPERQRDGRQPLPMT